MSVSSSLRDRVGGLVTSLRRFLGRSDFARWGRSDALEEAWDSRTIAIGKLVPPGSSVLEFGAGRMVLARHLPPGCRYTPSDIVDRGPGTLVCDLNAKSLPAFPRHDVAVFSGVLEYVNDVPRLVAHLATTVDAVVASYADIEGIPRRATRREHGWVNDYSAAELEEIFSRHGFRRLDTTRWGNQKIHVMSKRTA